MRAVIQRVINASVEVENNVVGYISKGLFVLVGIEDADTNEDADWLAAKISKMRLFEDENGIMNIDVKESNGEIIVVSQFTLHASTKKGNRPSYIKASRPEKAIPLYEYFVEQLKIQSEVKTETGKFGAHMKCTFTNDGPVTIVMDTKNKE